MSADHGWQRLAECTVLGLMCVSAGAQDRHVLFVDANARGASDGTSWTDGFTDLQDALSVAVPGTEVWVAAATYKPDGGTLNKSLSFNLVPGVEMIGGFSGVETEVWQYDPEVHPTILSGDLKGNDPPGALKSKDNSRHIIQYSGGASGTTFVNGFSIRGGVATGTTVGVGGGGLITAGNTYFVRCTFEQNLAFSGGAIGTTGNATVFVETCRFLENTAITSGGAIQVGENQTLILKSCVFVANSSNYSGGAVAVGDAADLAIDDCLFNGNSAKSGFAGGALSIMDSPASIRRCTFVNNQTVSGPIGLGAGVSIASTIGTSATIDSSIFWNNQSASGTTTQLDQLLIFPGTSASVSYSTIDGLSGLYGALGPGNSGLDPLFVDLVGDDGIPGTEDDDLTLQSDSPGIDSGDSLDVPSGTDLAGTPRFLDGSLDGALIVDRGAYEFSNVGLSLTGDPSPGEAITIDVDGTSGLEVLLIVAAKTGESLILPFGAALFDVGAPWRAYSLGTLPISLPTTIPAGSPTPLSFHLQALAGDTDTGVGNFSNSLNVVVD